MRRGIVALVVIAVMSACSSGKDDDDPRTVPEGITPEDAYFAFKQRITNGTQFRLLEIRLSKANICDRKTVPSETEWVDLNILVPPTSGIPAAIYGAGLDGQAEIVLQTSKSAECQSSQGLGVSRGSITIQEIDATHVKGSFVGTNTDTRLDLKGTFNAKPCPNDLSACL